MIKRMDSGKKELQKIAIIPARYASTRLEGKPLINIYGKPLIQWVWEAVSKSELLDSVYIATDNDLIIKTCNGFGANAIMTPETLPSGTDRIHYAWKEIGSPEGIIINVQGDEPLVRGTMLDRMINELLQSSAQVATFIKKINNYNELTNPNNVKVVIDSNNYALYFSRSTIPYLRDQIITCWHKNFVYWKHIGIYGFKSDTLDAFVNLPQSSLETAERLEQLRLLENSYRIKCIETNIQLIGVDTREDIELAEQVLSNQILQVNE